MPPSSERGRAIPRRTGLRALAAGIPADPNAVSRPIYAISRLRRGAERTSRRVCTEGSGRRVKVSSLGKGGGSVRASLADVVGVCARHLCVRLSVSVSRCVKFVIEIRWRLTVTVAQSQVPKTFVARSLGCEAPPSLARQPQPQRAPQPPLTARPFTPRTARPVGGTSDFCGRARVRLAGRTRQKSSAARPPY